MAGKWWEARNDYRRWLHVERMRAFSELMAFLTGLMDELPRDSDLQKRAPEVVTGITSRVAAARLVGSYELHKLATKALEDALRRWFARRGAWRIGDYESADAGRDGGRPPASIRVGADVRGERPVGDRDECPDWADPVAAGCPLIWTVV